MKTESEQLSNAETQQRLDGALKRSLKMPHKSHAPIGKRGATKAAPRKRSQAKLGGKSRAGAT
jgi:hypothetical protein